MELSSIALQVEDLKISKKVLDFRGLDFGN